MHAGDVDYTGSITLKAAGGGLWALGVGSQEQVLGWAGVITVALGIAQAAYVRWREARRIQDLKDVEATKDTWKAYYEQEVIAYQAEQAAHEATVERLDIVRAGLSDLRAEHERLNADHARTVAALEVSRQEIASLRDDLNRLTRAGGSRDVSRKTS